MEFAWNSFPMALQGASHSKPTMRGLEGGCCSQPGSWERAWQKWFNATFFYFVFVSADGHARRQQLKSSWR